MVFTNIWLAASVNFTLSSGALVSWSPSLGSGNWGAVGANIAVVTHGSQPALSFSGSPTRYVANGDTRLCSANATVLFAIHWASGEADDDQGIAQCWKDANNYASFRVDNGKLRYIRREGGSTPVDFTAANSLTQEGYRTYVGFTTTGSTGSVNLFRVDGSGEIDLESTSGNSFSTISGGTTQPRVGYAQDAAGYLNGDLEAIATHSSAMSESDISEDRWEIDADLDELN